MRLLAHNLLVLFLFILLFIFFPHNVFAETTGYRSATTITTNGATPYTNLSQCSVTDSITCDHPLANGYANVYFRNFGDFGIPQGSVINAVLIKLTGKSSHGVYIAVSSGTTYSSNCQSPPDLWAPFNGSVITTYNVSTPLTNGFLSTCLSLNNIQNNNFTWRINYSSIQNWSTNIDNFEIAFDYTPAITPTPTPTAIPAKTAVIFIPGIGGSELKASQDIFWSNSDGHGGTYSHGYASNEKIWVNQDEAVKIGDDDYFDVLRLKSDGVTSEADLSLTGNLTSFGYGDIDSFFTGLGYIGGTDFFIFPYDWRKDVRSTKDGLDSLVEEAKTKSGKTKVNIVAHSMGGLVARYYILDSSKAAKVDKLIELGVPHLGSVAALKTILYGSSITYNFYSFAIPIIPASEIKDVFANSPGVFQLLPFKDYYKYYDNSNPNIPYPFKDDRDIDNDKITGSLNFSQIKSLLTNLTHNMTVFAFGEQFHDDLDQKFNQSNGVNIYSIVGSNQPTLGQLHETWWIKWPINIIRKTDEIFINGDGTVPLYSASLKGSSLDLSGGAIIYYVDENHGDLVKSTGQSMQVVKSILETSSLPVEVKTQKIDLEGKQVSIDDGTLDLYDDAGNHTGLKSNGEIETNIPNTFYSTVDKSVNAFISKSANNIKAQVTSKSDTITTDIKIRFYEGDQITKTALYKDISVPLSAKAEFTLNPATLASPAITLSSQTIQPTAEVLGSSASDQTPPKTTIKKDGATVTLSATDEGAGVLKIEYSLDNGKTVKTYESPFTITASGKTTVQVKAIDKLGNQEIPQETIVEVSSSESSSSSGSSNSSSSTSSVTSEVSGSKTTQAANPNSTPTPIKSGSTESPVQNNLQPQGKQTKEVLGITAQSAPSIREQIMLFLTLLPQTLPGVISGLIRLRRTPRS